MSDELRKALRIIKNLPPPATAITSPKQDEATTEAMAGRPVSAHRSGGGIVNPSIPADAWLDPAERALFDAFLAGVAMGCSEQSAAELTEQNGFTDAHHAARDYATAMRDAAPVGQSGRVATLEAAIRHAIDRMNVMRNGTDDWFDLVDLSLGLGAALKP